MKIKDLEGVRKKTPKELEEMLIQLESAKMKAVSEKLAGKGKNLKVTRNLRKDIAQLKTIIREKQLIDKITNKNS